MRYERLLLLLLNAFPLRELKYLKSYLQYNKKAPLQACKIYKVR